MQGQERLSRGAMAGEAGLPPYLPGQAESSSSRTIGLPGPQSEQVMPLIALTTKPSSCHTCRLLGREASTGCSAPGQEKALPWAQSPASPPTSQAP